MKFLKNKDVIGMIVLMVIILSAYTLRDNAVKRVENIQKHSVPHMDYRDIDTQTQPFLDSGY